MSGNPYELGFGTGPDPERHARIETRVERERPDHADEDDHSADPSYWEDASYDPEWRCFRVDGPLNRKRSRK